MRRETIGPGAGDIARSLPTIRPIGEVLDSVIRSTVSEWIQRQADVGPDIALAVLAAGNLRSAT